MGDHFYQFGLSWLCPVLRVTFPIVRANVSSGSSVKLPQCITKFLNMVTENMAYMV